MSTDDYTVKDYLDLNNIEKLLDVAVHIAERLRKQPQSKELQMLAANYYILGTLLHDRGMPKSEN